MISARRIWAVAFREVREILRDRLFFALAFLVPSTILLLLGFGLSLDVENIPIAVLDYDKSNASRDYVNRYRQSPYFDYRGEIHRLEQADDLIGRGEIRMVLVIPERFEEDLAAARGATLQTLVDGTFPSRTQILKGYLEGVNGEASLDYMAEVMGERQGRTPEAIREGLEPIKLRVRYLYNQALVSTWSIVPKLIMVVLMMSAPFLTALGIVREKESGAIYNIYASDAGVLEFLLGKITPYFVISVFNGLLLWFFAVELFSAPFKGSASFFFLSTVVYVACTTGMGLLISIVVKSQMAAMLATSIITMLPAVLYSGLIIPISSLDAKASFLAHCLPAMYYARIVDGCFLKASPPEDMMGSLIILSLYAIALSVIGLSLFTKRPNR